MPLIMTLELSVSTERDTESETGGWKATGELYAVTTGPDGGRTLLHTTVCRDANYHVVTQMAAGAVLEEHGHFRRTYMAQCARD
jgi:hypothetical protein